MRSSRFSFSASPLLPRLKPLVLAVALSTLAPVALAQSAPLDTLRQLVGSGRMQEAYDFAQKNEGELGNPDFDYLFGLAAIESGHVSAGVLALERFVAANPADQAARLELGRGYFILGEDARSLEEFKGVLALNPPKPVRDNIERFTDAIRARQTAYSVTTRAFIETGFGHDSNVNAGPARNFNLPSGAQFTITDNQAVGQSTYFVPYSAGVSVSVPIKPGVIASGSAAIDGRQHNGGVKFESGSYDLAGGLSILDEDNLYRVTAGYSDFLLDDAHYRRSLSLGGEFQRQLDQRNIFSLFLQASTLDYEAANTVRDGKSIVAGANLRHALLDTWATQLTAAAFVGRDLNANNRHDFSRELIGVRAGVSTAPFASWVLSGGLSYSESRYLSPDQSFLGAINQNQIALALNGPEPDTYRRDNSTGVDLAATWILNKNLSLRFDASWSKNDSNIEVYSYTRTAYSVKARYEFF